jgi:cellulose synthase/poly-beta-1,6-N-acetylglucosamine synthase-like glycosyltransferase
MSEFAPSISVIAPAFNEETNIIQSVESFLKLDYPNFEVIVVNDGSTDQTLSALKDYFKLRPVILFYDSQLSTSDIRGVYESPLNRSLIVIDKEQGGKADSINVGIGFSRNELFCAVDSDSIVASDGLLRVVLPFIERPETTIASGGTIRPVNGCEVSEGRLLRTRLPNNPLALIQVVEYLRAFLFGRLGWNVLNSTMIISGAFGLFRKSAVLEVGGYNKNTVGEDMELIIRLRDHYSRTNQIADITFVPDPICWTEVPESFRVLGRQRDRWQRGLAETLWSNRHMLFNPKFGVVGLVAYPYFLVIELFGPIIELIGYITMITGIIFQWTDPALILLLLLVDVVYGLMMSIAAILLEESAFRTYPRISQIFGLLVAAFVEYFGYRQFAAFCRVRGLVSFFRRDRTWGKMRRVGISSTP